MGKMKEYFMSLREVHRDEFLDDDYQYQQWLNAEQPYISAKKHNKWKHKQRSPVAPK